MGWNDVKVTTTQLCTIKRAAVTIEARYMQERMFLSLKKKYRPPYGGYSQWGSGGDYSGKTNKKKGNNTAGRVKVANKSMVKRVNGLNGHSKMEEVK